MLNFLLMAYPFCVIHIVYLIVNKQVGKIIGLFIKTLYFEHYSKPCQITSS